MYGKGHRLHEPAGAPRPRRHGPWRLILPSAVLFCLAIFRFTAPTVTGKTPRAHREPVEHGYPGEHIGWETCGSLGSDRPLECSTISVPMDQFGTRRLKNETFTIPLIRLRGREGSPNLLLNPGGPGASGVEFIYRRGEQISTIVGEGFHLVGFDPRGVNGSEPFAACYPDGETRRARGSVRDERVVEDSAEVYAWSSNYVQACAETIGEHGKYVNTPQTAADMNSILDALGQRDMIYWGFSYGTILGQTYAGLYPERSKRVIIDGVNNLFDWYGELLDEEDLVDAETVFDGLLHECTKVPERCALSTFGSTKGALRERILSFASALREQPVSVYVNRTTYGLLDDRILLYRALAVALKRPGTWYTLASNLAKWLEGNATEALLAYGLEKPWPPTGDANRLVMLNDGASGPRYWPQDRETMLEWLVPFINRSIFAPTEHGIYYAKQQWMVPRTHNYVPVYGVKTAHPLLILTMTYDPVCPLVSARNAQQAFEGSQVVEVQGYGHCSIAMPSLCLARHVRAFLSNGRVPESHTLCEVDGGYFMPPEEDPMKAGQEMFANTEEQRLHAAQVILARDWA